MSLIKIYSAKLNGVNAVPTQVEVTITSGIGIHLVGLADAAVKESLLRTTTALEATGYHVPGKNIIINIAPSDIYKTGSHYDLPIALGILAASGQVDAKLFDYNHCRIFAVGELGLDGSVRAVDGCFPMCDAIPDGCVAIVPAANEHDRHPDTVAVRTLAEAIGVAATARPETMTLIPSERRKNVVPAIAARKLKYPKLSELHVDEAARRAAVIAAAGGHDMIVIGSNADKEGLTKALAGLMESSALMDDISDENIHTRASILSITGHDVRSAADVPYVQVRSDLSSVADLCGNASTGRPGKMTLADQGVLHYVGTNGPATYLEILRSGLEDREVKISRLRSVIEWPARFRLVYDIATCQCGHFGEGDKCTCTKAQHNGYMRRMLPGPLVDRIDVQTFVREGKPVAKEESAGYDKEVMDQLIRARKAQAERYAKTNIRCNADLSCRDAERFVPLDKDGQEMIEKIMSRMGFTLRAYFRIIKIARTIADIEGSGNIKPAHLAEAASFRFLDRFRSANNETFSFNF